MDSLITRLTRSTQFLATLLLVCIVAINTANVIGRYVFSSPIGWAEEVMLYFLIGAVFLTFVRITRDAAHVRMDMLVRAMPRRFQIALETAVDAITLSVCLTAAYAGAPIVMKLIEFDQRSDSSHIPMALPQGVIPFGFSCAALVLAVGIAARIRRGDASDIDSRHK
ncbi:MAG: TRAP transporter small permease [Betaproteobacteria bacterium]|nr:TRAP transporter small permease [Betaproteobacteria bacterium]